MSCLISIVQLESAINSACQEQPAIHYALQPDVRAMAEIYGRMIYQKVHIADLDLVPARLSQAVVRWLPLAEVAGLHLVQQACFYRPGDPEFDSCEACQ